LEVVGRGAEVLELLCSSGMGSTLETRGEDTLREAAVVTKTTQCWIEANHPGLAGWGCV
jgi:hypothetical protein